MSNEISLQGRVAIVTGAGSGLGRSHALSLAKRGAIIVAGDVNAANADSVVREIEAVGGTAIAHTGNIMIPDEAANLTETALKQFGRVDIIINNAGFLRDRSFSKISIKEIEEAISVHLLGAFYVTRAAWPFMKNAGFGRIVLTSSSSGLYGCFGQSNYGAGKAGLIGLMNALKLEGAKHNVLINTLAPFAISPLSDDFYDEAIKRRIQPDFVSELVAFLSSEECDLNGEIFEVGGGRIARVVIARSDGIVLPETPSAEQFRASMPRILQQTSDLQFASLGDSVSSFLRHITGEQIAEGQPEHDGFSKS